MRENRGCSARPLCSTRKARDMTRNPKQQPQSAFVLERGRSLLCPFSDRKPSFLSRVLHRLRAEVGFPIGYFWGYKTNGVFQNADEVAAATAKLEGTQPGDLIYVDTNGDGAITDDDKVMIGDPNPDFQANLSQIGRAHV